MPWFWRYGKDGRDPHGALPLNRKRYVRVPKFFIENILARILREIREETRKSAACTKLHCNNCVMAKCICDCHNRKGIWI